MAYLLVVGGMPYSFNWPLFLYDYRPSSPRMWKSHQLGHTHMPWFLQSSIPLLLQLVEIFYSQLPLGWPLTICWPFVFGSGQFISWLRSFSNLSSSFLCSIEESWHFSWLSDPVQSLRLSPLSWDLSAFVLHREEHVALHSPPVSFHASTVSTVSTILSLQHLCTFV